MQSPRKSSIFLTVVLVSLFVALPLSVALGLFAADRQSDHYIQGIYDGSSLALWDTLSMLSFFAGIAIPVLLPMVGVTMAVRIRSRAAKAAAVASFLPLFGFVLLYGFWLTLSLVSAG